MGPYPVFCEPMGAPEGAHVVSANKESVLCWCMDSLCACLSLTSAATKNAPGMTDSNDSICHIFTIISQSVKTTTRGCQVSKPRGNKQINKIKVSAFSVINDSNRTDSNQMKCWTYFKLQGRIL